MFYYYCTRIQLISNFTCWSAATITLIYRNVSFFTFIFIEGVTPDSVEAAHEQKCWAWGKDALLWFRGEAPCYSETLFTDGYPFGSLAVGPYRQSILPSSQFDVISALLIHHHASQTPKTIKNWKLKQYLEGGGAAALFMFVLFYLFERVE